MPISFMNIFAKILNYNKLNTEIYKKENTAELFLF